MKGTQDPAWAFLRTRVKNCRRGAFGGQKGLGGCRLDPFFTNLLNPSEGVVKTPNAEFWYHVERIQAA